MSASGSPQHRVKARALAVGIVVTATVGLVAATIGSANASSVAAAAPIKVMPLGDSITYGLGDPQLGAYRTVLYQKLVQQDGDNIDFVGSVKTGPSTLPDRDNEGHSGHRIDEIRSDIDTYMANGKPDIVVLHIGTNDLMQNYQVSTMPSRLQDLVSRICVDKPGVRVVVAQIIPRPGLDSEVKTFDAAIPGVVANLDSAGCHASVINLNSVIDEKSGLDLNKDATHPTPLGYSKMANALYPVVTSLYKSLTGATTTSTTAVSTTTAPTTSTTTVATTSGLTGSYFANTTLTGTPSVVRIDPQVVYNWGTASPASGIPADNFSVRWTGYLVPPKTGSYTIGTESANGIRVYVNGALVINDWTTHNTKWDVATFNLAAGSRPAITIEYYATTGSAIAHLSWSGPGISWGPTASAYLAP